MGYRSQACLLISWLMEKFFLMSGFPLKSCYSLLLLDFKSSGCSLQKQGWSVACLALKPISIAYEICTPEQMGTLPEPCFIPLCTKTSFIALYGGSPVPDPCRGLGTCSFLCGCTYRVLSKGRPCCRGSAKGTKQNRESASDLMLRR